VSQHKESLIYCHAPQVNDTAMRLFSDTQDEDQRRIADLVVERMEKEYPPKLEPNTATGAALTGNLTLLS